MTSKKGSANWHYDDKVALVVGASSGIGLAIAERLLASGARVAVVGRRTSELEAFQARSPERAVAITADVTDADQVARMVQHTVEAFGRLDVAFNVAANLRLGQIVDLSEADWDAVQDGVLRSAFICVKHQAGQMIRQGVGGAIVNVTSVSAHIPGRGAAAYSSAKAGLEMLTRTAALELAEHSIRVNALSPGLVNTPLTEPVLAQPGVLDIYRQRIAQDRAADPFEMTGPALFLGSDEASYVTGSILVADGGWSQTGYPDFRQLA
ncbi:SDR family oxidoreductase [Sphingobium sp.]|uniref:SDR family NAD(P)-dependent oxidoreductase n=1 Tax=Sphingobium sp. TaxID=1912891 RepID=UPI0028BD937C|nr:SDR family oxidoreductase [Sphingobium sp.]